MSGRRGATALLWLAISAGPAAAQGVQTVPNALQGFSQNRDQPVQIEATSLEVRDKSGIATFSGNVKVVQGDTTMRCKSLVVYYQSKTDGTGAAPAMKAATPGPTGQQQISRMEFSGGVIVTQKEQTVTGDNGLYDLKTNMMTLNGNVIMSQGKNVMKGQKLVVNLTSGEAKVDGGKNAPVQMVIEQNPQGGPLGGKPGDKAAKPGEKPAASAKPGDKPADKPAAQRPASGPLPRPPGT